MAKRRLKHNPVLLISISISLVLSMYFFIVCIRIYNRNVAGASLKNSLEDLEQVKNAEVEVAFFWFDGDLDFDVKLELLSGDTIFLENIHKDMGICKSFGSLKSINELSFIYCRIPISSSPGLPLDLLQIYMNDDLSTVPLFLNKYSEIKESVEKLPSVQVFHNDSGKILFDTIEPLGQDLAGHYFKLFKVIELY